MRCNGAHFHPPTAREIEEKITDKTRAIVICNPDNPTGAVWSLSEIASLLEVAVRHNLIVIFDEVYREWNFVGKPFTALSAASDDDALSRIIILDSVSKRYHLTGARTGVAVSCNPQTAAALLSIAQARISTGEAEQRAVIPVLQSGKKYINRDFSKYVARRDFLHRRLSRIPGVLCNLSKGAIYTLLRIKGVDTDDFAEYLLRHVRVNGETALVTPLRGFLLANKALGSEFIRIANVLDKAKLGRVADIIEIGLEAYK